MPIWETSRLLLREMTLDDLDFMASMLGDADVTRYYPKVYSRDEAATWIEKQQWRYSEHGHGLWLAIDKATGQPIGQVGLCLQDVEAALEPEIGYMIHTPYWKQGFASEAARAVLGMTFTRFDYDHAISLIRPVNIPSQRVALSLGMKPQRLVAFAGNEHIAFAISRSEADCS